MKDLLDEFNSLTSPPVAVYLRINNKSQHINPFFKKKETSYNQLDNDSINQCTRLEHNISDIKFKEIFDAESFGDNSVLAKYMSIPTFLSQGKSIMFLTYGYSGVGKTFTVFGTTGKQGILQTALLHIQHSQIIKYRTYELYGLAFPYKSYWNTDIKDYNHFIYNYTNDYINPEIIKANNMQKFINNMETYKEISKEDITNFHIITNNIDDTRKREGRIKKTKNNDFSSRSIMIFDFKITIQDGKEVFFVIFDLPGKENIKETFVENDTCFKNKENVNASIRNLAFLSPLSLMLTKYHKPFFETFERFIDDSKFKLTYLGDSYERGNGSRSDEFSNYYSKIFDDSIVGTKNLSLEIMRYMIENNKFDELTSFYEQNLFEKKEVDNCYIKDGYSKAPFEGYYINENIIGLLTTLLKHLKLNFNVIKKQDDIFLNIATNNEEFKKKTGKKTISSKSKEPDYTKIESEISKPKQFYNNKINTELLAQTYFFRFLLKENNNHRTLHEKFDFDLNFLDKELNYWINETYDYNKGYKIETPPISILLDTYFNKIQHFYLFYVVSNDNVDANNCEKQIQLISDCKVFLDELSKYKK